MQDFQKLLEESDLLFRGTNTHAFDYRKKTSDFYFGSYRGLSGPVVTSTSFSWEYARTYAAYSTEKNRSRGLETKPLLLKIDFKNYKDRIRPGTEFTMGLEVEILGPIDFSDIEIIDSVERLRDLVDPPEQLIDAFQKSVLEE